MARVEVEMRQMGESVMEGTVIEWTKNVGDSVEEDETLLEIATDKVDTEVPSPQSGTLVEILAEEDETIEVGQVIAIIDTDPDAAGESAQEEPAQEEDAEEADEGTSEQSEEQQSAEDTSGQADQDESAGSGTGESEGERVEVEMPQMGESVMEGTDRKSTRLNSSHVAISYAVFCLKK